MSVIFYPQMQGTPTVSDATVPNTTYSFHIPSYDPETHGDPVLKTTSGTGDYNNYVYLNELSLAGAFKTVSTWSYISDSTAPAWVSFDTPGNSATDVSVTTDIVMTFNEPIDPATVTQDGIQVYATDGTIYARVPGTFTVVNYPGPDGEDMSVITFTPLDDLPAGMDFEVVINSGVLDDFRGNTATSLPAPQGFVSESGSTTTWSETESFDDHSRENTDETTAYWGTNTPGKLTGIDEAGGGGSNLTVSGTTTLTGTSGADGNVWEYDSLTVSGTLRFNMNACDSDKKFPRLLVKGPVNITGTSTSPARMASTARGRRPPPPPAPIRSERAAPAARTGERVVSSRRARTPAPTPASTAEPARETAAGRADRPIRPRATATTTTTWGRPEVAAEAMPPRARWVAPRRIAPAPPRSTPAPAARAATPTGVATSPRTV